MIPPEHRKTELFDNGRLDISSHNAPGVTLGSVKEPIVVDLGARNLTIGCEDDLLRFDRDRLPNQAAMAILTLSNSSTYRWHYGCGGRSQL